MRISRGGTKVRDRAAKGTAKGAAKVVRVRRLQQGNTCTLQETLAWCMVTVLSAVSSDGGKHFNRSCFCTLIAREYFFFVETLLVDCLLDTN